MHKGLGFGPGATELPPHILEPSIDLCQVGAQENQVWASLMFSTALPVRTSLSRWGAGFPRLVRTVVPTCPSCCKRLPEESMRGPLGSWASLRTCGWESKT